MVSLIQYHIDAFTQKLFSGNPAAIIMLDAPLDAALMQAIAFENNLSETAFLLPQTNHPYTYDIRWFTPVTEIGFCGHATLAAAHALYAELARPPSPDGRYNFLAPQTSGLHVTITNRTRPDVSEQDSPPPLYALTAPVSQAIATPLTPQIRAAFPVPLSGAFHAGENLYVIANHAQDVESYTPDFLAITNLGHHGIGLTAKGGREGAHCTSRFFVPSMGINEDPVTGSAHTAIGPYWAQRLGTNHLKAYQASARGGWLSIDLCDDRVTLTGSAITFSKAHIRLS